MKDRNNASQIAHTKWFKSGVAGARGNDPPWLRCAEKPSKINGLRIWAFWGIRFCNTFATRFPEKAFCNRWNSTEWLCGKGLFWSIYERVSFLCNEGKLALFCYAEKFFEKYFFFGTPLSKHNEGVLLRQGVPLRCSLKIEYTDHQVRYSDWWAIRHVREALSRAARIQCRKGEVAPLLAKTGLTIMILPYGAGGEPGRGETPMIRISSPLLSEIPDRGAEIKYCQKYD